MENSNKNLKILVGVIVAVIIGLGALWFWGRTPQVVESSALDGFASCLAEKQITMYGAEWCPHCQSQKKLFGDSFRLVPYVECPDNIQFCLAKGIEGYPTWIFPDGQKLVGEQRLEKLSEISGCSLLTNKATTTSAIATTTRVE